MNVLDRLATVLPDYEHRPEQIALAEAVERALAEEEHLLAQAGTGTGKSLGYLLPALQSGRRVVVATATKALQEQLLTKDIPLAAAALGREVRVAVLKGRQNYLCRRRVDGVQFTGLGLLGAAGDVDAYERLLPWIDSTATGDRAELDAKPSASLWAELAVGSDRCLGRRCAHVASCYAELARHRAGAAELVIANHALYFADLALREETDDGARVLPEHDAVIFDEAHKLEESAATWLGARITVGAVRRLVADAFQAADEAGVATPVHAAERIELAVEELLRAVAPPSGRRRVRDLPHGLAVSLIEQLEGLAEALRGRGDELDAVAARAGKLAGDVAACLETSRPDRVVWAEPGALAYAPSTSPSPCATRSGRTARRRSSSPRRSSSASSSAASASTTHDASTRARRSTSARRLCSTFPGGWPSRGTRPSRPKSRRFAGTRAAARSS